MGLPSPLEEVAEAVASVVVVVREVAFLPKDRWCSKRRRCRRQGSSVLAGTGPMPAAGIVGGSFCYGILPPECARRSGRPLPWLPWEGGRSGRGFFLCGLRRARRKRRVVRRQERRERLLAVAAQGSL